MKRQQDIKAERDKEIVTEKRETNHDVPLISYHERARESEGERERGRERERARARERASEQGTP